MYMGIFRKILGPPNIQKMYENGECHDYHSMLRAMEDKDPKIAEEAKNTFPRLFNDEKLAFKRRKNWDNQQYKNLIKRLKKSSFDSESFQKILEQERKFEANRYLEIERSFNQGFNITHPKGIIYKILNKLDDDEEIQICYFTGDGNYNTATSRIPGYILTDKRIIRFYGDSYKCKFLSWEFKSIVSAKYKGRILKKFEIKTTNGSWCEFDFSNDEVISFIEEHLPPNCQTN